MTLLGGVGDSSGMDAASNAAYNYVQAHAYGSNPAEAPNEYDLRVSKFLDMTRDDDNYEEKVRKLVEEASKYTKDRKMQEEKSKKKDRKKSKKNKKDSKKKKKEKKSKSSKKDKEELIDGIELREALKYVATDEINTYERHYSISIYLQNFHQIAAIRNERQEIVGN